MRPFVLLLLAGLVILSACSLASPSTPPSQPGNVIQTIAAQTAAAATLATWTPQSGDTTSEATATPQDTETPTSTEELPTLTPEVATLTAVPPAGPVYPAITQRPDQFIMYYFANINVSNYPLTWSLLTNRFKANNNPPSAGGYTGYVNYWNTVHDVSVLAINIASQSGGYAVVVVNSIYHYNGGTSIDDLTTYSLIYDYTRATWMFDSPSGAYVPPVYITPVYYPPTTQTPEQFVYYYFANINISNYTLTWSLLTDRFKSHNNPPSSGGYDGYVSYWDTVHDVQVLSVVITIQSGGYAALTVYALYNYNSGTSIYNTQTYNLTYDYSRGTWLFDSP